MTSTVYSNATSGSSTSTDLTLRDGLDGMIRRFDASKARGIDATVQMVLTGNGGGDYQVHIKDGKAQLARGTAEKPAATVEVASSVWLDILAGKLDPTAAFMGGKLKVSGDMGLMMRFQSMFIA